MAQASPPREQGVPEWEEQAHGRYAIYEHGHSRTMTIPAPVGMEKDDSFEMWRGQYEGETIYLKAIPVSTTTPPDVDAHPIPVGVTEEQVYDRGRSQWKVRECSKGERTFTIPACCASEQFGEESPQVLVSGWAGGEIGYLMTVPVRFWSGPEGIAGGLEFRE